MDLEGTKFITLQEIVYAMLILIHRNQSPSEIKVLKYLFRQQQII
jgi:hypothetical protein